MGKQKKRNKKWKNLVHSNSPPPIVQCWRPCDEKNMPNLKENGIKLNDTALKRQQDIEWKKILLLL